MDLNNGLSKLFERFITEKRFLSNLSERTIASYTEIFARWQRLVGEFPTRENLSTFVIEMRQAGLSPTTCNISIRSFNSFLSWLRENGHLAEPFKIKQLKAEKKIMRTFSDEQLAALLKWKPDPKSRNQMRAYAVLCTLTDCGFRVSEALGIEVSNVDFDNLLIKVKGMGSKERLVPMSIELRKILFRYCTKHRISKFKSPYFFCTANGTKMTYYNLYRDLSTIFEKVGVNKEDIDGFFHAFRRKFARSYVKAGGNVIYLQRAMGHSSLQMTQAYVEVEVEDLQETHIRTSLLSRLR